jgi:hypothetical protein
VTGFTAFVDGVEIQTFGRTAELENSEPLTSAGHDLLFETVVLPKPTSTQETCVANVTSLTGKLDCLQCGSLTTGAYSFAPSGCSYHRTKFNAYWNRNPNGVNNGNYISVDPISTTPQISPRWIEGQRLRLTRFSWNEYLSLRVDALVHIPPTTTTTTAAVPGNLDICDSEERGKIRGSFTVMIWA